MNYFELFEIPVQLRVDGKSLSEKFFALSRKYHPDHFVNKEAKEQAESLEKSALLNKAYKAFQNTDDTIKYVLLMKALMVEEEKYDLPPDFLMEVLEINDQLLDANEDPGLKTRIQSQVETLQNEIYEPVKEIVEHYQEGVTSKEELLQVKAYYYKKKYLQRIRRQLMGMM